MNKNKYQPGDIVLVKFNKSKSSVIINKKRPAVIVSNSDITRTSQHLHVIPLTTSKNKNRYSSHVKFTRNGATNTALCEQVTCVPTQDIEKTDDWVSRLTMNRIKTCLKNVFDIN